MKNKNVKSLLTFALSIIVASSVVADKPVFVALKGLGSGNPFWGAVEKGAREKVSGSYGPAGGGKGRPKDT